MEKLECQGYQPSVYVYGLILSLPPASEGWGRYCFHRCLSLHTRGGGVPTFQPTGGTYHGVERGVVSTFQPTGWESFYLPAQLMRGGGVGYCYWGIPIFQLTGGTYLGNKVGTPLSKVGNPCVLAHIVEVVV